MLQSLLLHSKLFFSLLLASIFLIIFDSLGLLNLPKSIVQNLTSPLQYGLYKTELSITHQFDFIILARRSAQEHKALTEQMAQILSENANLRRKLAETEGFLNQQNTLSPQTFNMVAARPVGLSRFLLIDKGSDDGLKLSQAVVYKDNYIGKIKSLSSKKAQVMLSSDPDSRIAAFVADQNGKAKGVLLGQFGSDMLLDKILHQEPVSKNDLVYSEGTELEIPRGLIIGQVSEVLDRDNEVFKQAKVKSVFDVTNLDVVFVITN